MPCDGDRIVIVSDVIGSLPKMDDPIDRLLELADVEVAAILVIAETCVHGSGRKRLESKYHTKVHSLLSDEEIRGTLCAASLPVQPFSGEGRKTLIPFD